MKYSLILIIFLLAPGYCFSFANGESWKRSNLLKDHKNVTGVNPQCANDTGTWLHSLSIMAEISLECILTKKCSNSEEALLKEHLYALEQLDAFGKIPSSGLFEIPLIFDGSYQECERISGERYETNYCYVILIPGNDSSQCHFTEYQHLTFSKIFVRSAVCMPSSCDERDISELVNQISDVPFVACKTHCAKFPVSKDASFWIFTVFMALVIFIAILATFIDYIMDSLTTKEKKERGKNGEKQSIFLIILLTFSLWTNAELILSVKEQKAGFIKCLDCIRFFSMLWVVSGHTIHRLMLPDVLLPITDFTHHLRNHIFLNAFFSVDTFLLLSGIIVSYLFFKNRLKSSQIKSPITWILFYVHRYLRLTPPYMIFLGFFIVYNEYVQGPVAAAGLNSGVLAVENCRKTWWKNLLYINNFGDNTEACYGITWYLAVDTQLYLIAPLVLIALWFSYWCGILAVAAGCAGSIITVYILYFEYDLPADEFGNGNHSKFAELIYDKPWIRCTPYLIGLLVGYGLAVFGKRRIRLHWLLAVTGWLIALGIAAACLFSTNEYDKGAVWNKFEKATYYNFSRFIWAIAVSWVIVANHLGWAGPIHNFMSHPMWQPFGKLSYCAYIVHYFLISFYMNINVHPMHYYSSFQVWIYYAVPITLLSYVLAFFWSCLFEIPILKQEKMLINAILRKNISRESENAEKKNSENESNKVQQIEDEKETINTGNIEKDDPNFVIKI